MARQTTSILRESKAGLDEKGDIVVCLSPAKKSSGIQIEIDSTVKSLFGDQIRASVLGVVEGVRAYGSEARHPRPGGPGLRDTGQGSNRHREGAQGV